MAREKNRRAPQSGVLPSEEAYESYAAATATRDTTSIGIGVSEMAPMTAARAALRTQRRAAAAPPPNTAGI